MIYLQSLCDLLVDPDLPFGQPWLKTMLAVNDDGASFPFIYWQWHPSVSMSYSFTNPKNNKEILYFVIV